jgi:hypothetical protein
MHRMQLCAEVGLPVTRAKMPTRSPEIWHSGWEYEIAVTEEVYANSARESIVPTVYVHLNCNTLLRAMLRAANSRRLPTSQHQRSQPSQRVASTHTLCASLQACSADVHRPGPPAVSPPPAAQSPLPLLHTSSLLEPFSLSPMDIMMSAAVPPAVFTSFHLPSLHHEQHASKEA